MSTRKTFTALAERLNVVLNRTRNFDSVALHRTRNFDTGADRRATATAYTKGCQDGLAAAARIAASTFAEDNPRFDYAKFYAAVGLDSNGDVPSEVRAR